MSKAPISGVLRRHEAQLRTIPEVRSVGLGEDSRGNDTIIAFVGRDVDDLDAVRALVPTELEGYPTEIRPEIIVYPGRGKGDQEDGSQTQT
jgi:hypothetical protein